MNKSPLRVGVGGPVGSGKTALVEALCKALRDRYQLGLDSSGLVVDAPLQGAAAAGSWDYRPGYLLLRYQLMAYPS